MTRLIQAINTDPNTVHIHAVKQTNKPYQNGCVPLV